MDKKSVSSAQYNLGFNSRLSKYRAEYLKYIITKYNIHSIMDVGCGIGDMFDYLEATYPGFLSYNLNSIVLVEPFMDYYDTLKSKFGNNPLFHIKNDTIENLGLNVELDLVIAVDVLEHVDSPVGIIDKLKMNVCSDGYFLAVVPNAYSLHRQVGLKMGLMDTLYDLGEHDLLVGHQRYYDAKELDADFFTAGFTLSERSGIVFKPLPNSKMNELSEEYIDALYELGLQYPEFCGEIAGLYKKNV